MSSSSDESKKEELRCNLLKQSTPQQSDGRKTCSKLLLYQIAMFFLCYLMWVAVHVQREFWAMSKEVIIGKNPELPTTFFGWLNMSLYLSYAVFMFFTGTLGDAYSRKYVLALSFGVQAVFFVIIGYMGLCFAETIESRLLLFCLMFILVGSVQSVDLPCIVATMGAWTRRSSRGTVTGAWATCGNVGNIIGLQAASLVLTRHEDNWESLMFIIAIMYISTAFLILLTFVSDP
mmetsp:Transcript_28597/g.35413  ORF Transcript_28597/g.35413 Transcript_28597/m.35413 type:complete len:233 (+) Transcript_28597:52-750(+)